MVGTQMFHHSCFWCIGTLCESINHPDETRFFLSNLDNQYGHPDQSDRVSNGAQSHQWEINRLRKCVPLHRDGNHHSTIHQLTHHDAGAGHTKYTGHKSSRTPDDISFFAVVIGILPTWTHALKITIFIIGQHNRILKGFANTLPRYSTSRSVENHIVCAKFYER